MEHAFAIVGCWMLAVALVAALVLGIVKGRNNG